MRKAQKEKERRGRMKEEMNMLTQMFTQAGLNESRTLRQAETLGIAVKLVHNILRKGYDIKKILSDDQLSVQSGAGQATDEHPPYLDGRGETISGSQTLQQQHSDHDPLNHRCTIEQDGTHVNRTKEKSTVERNSPTPALDPQRKRQLDNPVSEAFPKNTFISSMPFQYGAAMPALQMHNLQGTSNILPFVSPQSLMTDFDKSRIQESLSRSIPWELMNRNFSGAAHHEMPQFYGLHNTSLGMLGSTGTAHMFSPQMPLFSQEFGNPFLRLPNFGALHGEILSDQRPVLSSTTTPGTDAVAYQSPTPEITPRPTRRAAIRLLEQRRSSRDTSGYHSGHDAQKMAKKTAAKSSKRNN